MKSINGWNRLFIVFSGIYIILISIGTYVVYDNGSKYSYRSGRKMLILNYVKPNRNELAVISELNKEDFIDCMKNNSWKPDEFIKSKKNYCELFSTLISRNNVKKIDYINVFLIIFIVPVLTWVMLLLFVKTFNWVRAGFVK